MKVLEQKRKVTRKFQDHRILGQQKGERGCGEEGHHDDLDQCGFGDSTVTESRRPDQLPKSGLKEEAEVTLCYVTSGPGRGGAPETGA